MIKFDLWASYLWWVTFIAGTLVPVFLLGWLIHRGYQEWRLILFFFGLYVLWFAAWALNYSKWDEGVGMLMGLAFCLAVILLARQIKNSRIHRAEIVRLKSLTETRSDQVAALSHEIRTPLAMIRGAADLLLEGNPGPLTPQQLVFVKKISQNGEFIFF